MNKLLSKQTATILAGLAALVISWLFPPWTLESDSMGIFSSVPLGLHYILSDFPGPPAPYLRFRVDISRLVLIDLCILAVTVGAILVVRQPKLNP